MNQVIPQVCMLAVNVWMEARGESYLGKMAVAWATVNRANDPRWPETIHDVVLQAMQFSWTNPRDPNRMRLDEIHWDDPVWGDCLRAACGAYYNLVGDLTGGANHYYNPAVVTPSWHRDDAVTARIDQHVFLRL